MRSYRSDNRSRRTRLCVAAALAIALGACTEATGPQLSIPDQLVRVSAAEQEGDAGFPLAEPVRVKVIDTQGRGVAGQVVFAEPALPKYGAIGTFGIQGSNLPIADLTMLPADATYSLAGGRIYNVEGSSVINTGGGFSGAHSDIRKPEVAHLVWSAILTAAAERRP